MKKFLIHPLFILYIFVLVLLGQYQSILIYFLVVILHELGHAIMAKKLGYKLNKTVLMPYGICLNYNANFFAPTDEILIAISGPFVNFFMCIICFSLWWIFPSIYSYTQLFCYSNAILFLFNLLPCYPLDGGRVLAGILSKKIERKNAIKLVVVLNLCVCCVFILTFFSGLFFGVININILIITIFLFVGIFQPNDKSSYNYLTINVNRSQFLKKERQVKFTMVNSSEMLFKVVSKMSKYKFNIFYVLFKDEKIKVITEITLSKLMLMHSPTCTFEEILT